ncbi:RNA polymerase sigma factor [Hyphococcus sp.]|uniref:RNA polymerase sigma factor n=1 Tax=Hyphococcus sp. TaxID=2038636 RepID=UPI003D129658
MQTQISTAELNECLPALHRFALQLTRNQDRACDLVQDSVERALRKAHLFDGANLRSWLFTICRRVFLNQIRSEKTRGITVEMDDAPQSRLASAQTQEQIMHYNDVVDAFERLPLNDKVILSLVVIEGMKYEEAAAVLDVPVGTVRSRLSRARSRLMTMVEGENHENEGTQLAAVV